CCWWFGNICYQSSRLSSFSFIFLYICLFEFYYVSFGKAIVAISQRAASQNTRPVVLPVRRQLLQCSRACAVIALLLAKLDVRNYAIQICARNDAGCEFFLLLLRDSDLTEIWRGNP